MEPEDITEEQGKAEWRAELEQVRAEVETLRNQVKELEQVRAAEHPNIEPVGGPHLIGLRPRADAHPGDVRADRGRAYVSACCPV